MQLSIVIPVYNERNNIPLLVSKINSTLNNKIKYEIIIVDDSSTDGSTQTLKKLEKKVKKLKVIFRKNNQKDLSKSCRDGFELSKYNYIVVMDGDLQHDPIYIPKMIKILNKNNSDFVIGVRDLRNKRIKSLSFFRQFLSLSIIKIFEFFFEKKTNDPMSGFFLFKKKIYLNNKKKLFLKGFKILADLIYLNKKFKINDLKIKFNYRKKGKSKLNLRIALIIVQFLFIRFFKNLLIK
jgi:dolichol-phosphate mannosyltransferase